MGPAAGFSKPINRPSWWKGKFALFQMPASWEAGDGVWRGGRCLSQADSPPFGNHGAKVLSWRVRGGDGGDLAETAPSSLTVILNSFGHPVVSQRHPGCFRYS